MSIKLFTQTFMCAAMLGTAGVLLSCAQDNDAKAELIINKLSTFANCADSLRNIRDTNISDAEKESVLKMISDSTTQFQAMAISTILSHDEIAGYIIKNPSRELVNATSKYLLQLDGNNSVSAFASALDKQFRALTTAKQAEFLTNVATPAECATHLQDGDDELKNELIKIYSQDVDSSALSIFKQHITHEN